MTYSRKFEWSNMELPLFYWYYFGKGSTELAKLVPFPLSFSWSTRYADKQHDFETRSRLCKKVFAYSFFASIARLWNSPPADCFYFDWQSSFFKTNVNRYFAFQMNFWIFYSPFFFFLLLIEHQAVAVWLLVDWNLF